MSKLKKVSFIVILAALAGGTIFLLTWDIPAPAQPVTKTLNDDRFPS
ncbi:MULTISPECIES: hypothetical protein [Kordiimonadales]|uniref:Uncharacterized protein n=1 Tax=Gimibacter soli TaxID=3024400 RepID=A0AAE9XSF7_9PROT|nr:MULTISPECIES: hypothetical protein [Kordiimonadales]WCL54175.1 hypothetical protein PH603_00190 [Gimibacter soli]